MILLRARTLAAGLSGVRVDLVEALLALLGAGIVPWVPEHGSLGASGDLAPLARGRDRAARTGMDGRSGRRAYRRRIRAARSRADADRRRAQGGPRADQRHRRDDEPARARGARHRGPAARRRHRLRAERRGVARHHGRVRRARRRAPPGVGAGATRRPTSARCFSDSPIVASHRPSRHAVQDAYSLRCAPQVHGAARDAVAFCRQTVEHELASVVDNPVVLGDGRGERRQLPRSGARVCRGLLASVCADVAAISERRLDRLLDPARSRGLPAFLSPEPGLNSGLMITQYTAAAIVATLRHAATPFAVQSAATSAGQEDHVSMGYEAALRTRRSVGLLRVGARHRDDRRDRRGSRCVIRSNRRRPPVRSSPRSARSPDRSPSDRILSGDIEAVETWVREAAWREPLEAAGRDPPMTAGARPVRAPRGSALSCGSWQTEAPLRCLMNNLDPEVAENPDDAGGLRRHRTRGALLGVLRRHRGEPSFASRRRDPPRAVGQTRRRGANPRARPARAHRQLAAGTALGHVGGLLAAREHGPDHVRADDRGIVDLHRHPGHPPGHLRDVRGRRAEAFRWQPPGPSRADVGSRRHGWRAAARHHDERRSRAVHRGRPRAHPASPRHRVSSTRSPTRWRRRCDAATSLARRGARCRWPCAPTRRRRCRPCSSPPLAIDVVTDQTSAHDPLNGYIPGGMSLEAAAALRVERPRGLRAHARAS